MADKVETARAEVIRTARSYCLDTSWLEAQRADEFLTAVDALIAAVRAENDRKDREHPLIALYEQALTVECTCRVIEKCLRCEAIDALPSERR